MNKIKYKDVELNILKDVPIETDYMIADLFQNSKDSKDTDVYILNTVIEESQHYNIDTLDYDEIADYLNNINDDIREYYNYIINYPLDKFGKGYLSVAYK